MDTVTTLDQYRERRLQMSEALAPGTSKETIAEATFTGPRWISQYKKRDCHDLYSGSK